MANDRLLARMPTSWNDVLADLRRHATEASTIPPEAIPEMLGVLRAVEVTLLTRQLNPAFGAVKIDEPTHDTWLTADEVARRLQRTRTWVYRQARRWSFAKRPTRKTLLISERGLAAWMQRH